MPAPVKTGNGDVLLKKAMDEVASFHKLVDEKRYNEVCQASEPNAYRSTQLPCAEFLAYVHDKLGDALEWRRTRQHVPVRPEGEAVPIELHCATRYASALALEAFTWKVGGPKAILVSYTIDADALSR